MIGSIQGAVQEFITARDEYRRLILAGDVDHADLPGLVRRMGAPADAVKQDVAALAEIRELEAKVQPLETLQRSGLMGAELVKAINDNNAAIRRIEVLKHGTPRLYAA